MGVIDWSGAAALPAQRSSSESATFGQGTQDKGETPVFSDSSAAGNGPLLYIFSADPADPLFLEALELKHWAETNLLFTGANR